MIATFSPGWMSAIARGVQRAGERLDQHGVLVGAGRRGRCAAGTRVRDQALAPAAAGVAAEAGLQAGGDVAVGRVATQRDQALRALGARRPRPRTRAAERGLDDDALAAPRAGADLAHDLVAGDERRARQRRQMQRRLAGEQREVGAADAGQARADRQPVRAGRARRADLLQRAARPLRQLRRAWRRTWRCSACRSAPALRPPLARSSTPRSASGAVAPRGESRKSGLIACGWPTSSSIGRSREAVAVGVAVGEVDAVVGGEARGQRGAAVGGQRRLGQLAGEAPDALDQPRGDQLVAEVAQRARRGSPARR